MKPLSNTAAVKPKTKMKYPLHITSEIGELKTARRNLFVAGWLYQN
ncbi:hypothetical protein BF29_1457 [Heyndrickxia coagulans DSM 1 = ATCC 7050]|uniref:Uncharacterized protein n=1 Tax=Heyndrickxia coagulans DSM 1 = ATCC 7050 TaxID=1121088 RepID=A0A8B4BXY0_HEYCO|nr:hypothetical protein BF29_1457 [Heyndrickxia coagulans DSM 1 = ATCC 7050]SHF86001.1 hypothetical protein SAMN02745208_02799 [Heyndrickxia coagulans DSM 1 = ATCC 7050]